MVQNEVLIAMQMSMCFGFGPFVLRCLWSLNQNSAMHAEVEWPGCCPDGNELPQKSRGPTDGFLSPSLVKVGIVLILMLAYSENFNLDF